MFVCIDLGGNNIRGTWMDRSGGSGTPIALPRPRTLDGTKKILEALIRDLSREAREPVEQIGIASAGPLSLSSGVYIDPTNMPELKGFDLSGYIKETFNIAPVLENDAQASALGEIFKGSLKGEKDALVFTLGTGLGSGVIVSGKIWRGNLEAGPELGHIYLGPGRKKKCGCGQVGCAETWLNAKALHDLVEQNGIVLKSLKEVRIHLEQKDEKALKAMSQYGKRLGLYLSQMVSVFGIKKIGLSGGLSELSPYFLQSTRYTINYRLASRPWLLPDKLAVTPDPHMSALWGMGYLMFAQ